MQKKNLNIIISGSNGFLGSAIKKLFYTKGFSLVRIDIKKKFYDNLNKKKIFEDLRKKCKKNKSNLLIHLGWGSMAEPYSEYHKINYQKSKLLFDCCNEIGFQKIIFCGSMNEYGNRKGLLKENYKPKNLKTMYAKYKYLTTAYGIKKIKKFYSIRPSYIYGYNQRTGTLIDLLLKSIKKNKEISMSHCKIFRDYVFVDDVALAFFNISTLNGSEGIYNVGSGKVITLKKLILIIAQKANFNKNLLNFGKLPKRREQQHPKCFMDTKKIIKNFKWKMNYSLELGVNKILKKNKIK